MTRPRTDDELAERSGNVITTDPLVAFLYELMRDYVLPGDIEKLVRSSPQGEIFRLTNGWLAAYAADIAVRLKPKLIVAKPDVPPPQVRTRPFNGLNDPPTCGHGGMTLKSKWSRCIVECRKCRRANLTVRVATHSFVRRLPSYLLRVDYGR